MFALAQNLILAGYTAKQILNYLSKKVNGLEKSISNARSTGYDDESILNFLSKKLPSGQSRQAEENASQSDKYLSGIGFKTKQEKAVQKQKILQGVTGLAAGALGAYGAYRAFTAGSRAISPSEILPAESTIKPMGNPTGIGNVPKTGTANAPPPQVTPVTPIAPVSQPTVKSDIGSSSGILKSMELDKKVDNLFSSGNAADVISGVIQQQLTPGQKKWMKDQNVDLPKVIVDYVESKAQAPKTAQPSQEAILTSPEIEVQRGEEAPKVEPGKSVALPDGDIGEIEKIDPKQRYVTVNVDGKKRNVKFSDIDVEPEDVVDFVTQIAAIPESERSRMISFFAYQPQTKTLAVQYHNGTFYTYRDVDPEKIKPVVEATGVAKTTGKDEYGEHVAGRPDSRGAALIEEIINDAKYKKSAKGQEKNPNYEAFDTLFDHWKALRRKAKGKSKKIGTKP